MPQDPAEQIETRYRRIAITIVMMGVMMSAIDTTAVILGLPVMIGDLNSDILTMIWVLLAYLLVIAILGTQVGKLGDMFGRVRMYNLGFAVFTIGSLLCGISTDGTQLVAFRVLQGIGGALISSNSGAIIADTFPMKERGKAFGFAGMGFSIGAILGILIGGAFVTFLNWRYIFFINLPIGVVATIAGYYLLKERSPRKRETLDYGGITLFGLSLFLILYAITSITGSGWNLEYGLELVVGIVAFIGFLLWERRSSSPFLDLSLFHDRIFAASSFAAFFQSLANYAVIFLIIMYLQGPRGMSPWNASLLLIPGYILGGLIAPISGRLSDRHGARVIASLGLVLMIAGILVYSTLSLDSSVYVVVLGSVLSGAGSSTFFPANTSAVMANSPPKYYGISSGLLRTMSNIGMVCSFAVALFITSIAIPRDIAFQIFLGTGFNLNSSLATSFVDGMHAALLSSISLLVIALVLSILRGKEARTHQHEATPGK
jgi:EmrB/QacA subfamily drug resistance transporter